MKGTSAEGEKTPEAIHTFSESESPYVLALRKAKSGVPEGTFYAWAEPKIAISREEIKSMWRDQLEELVLSGTMDEKSPTAEDIQAAVDTFFAEVQGSKEFYSLGGYGIFERELFKEKYWKSFCTRFPKIAPHLERFAARVHSLLRLKYQPEILEAAVRYLREARVTEWTPNFFKRHADKQAQALHSWIRNHARGFDGRVDWPLLVNAMPKDLQEGFTKHESGTPIEDAQLIPYLIETIEKVFNANGFWTPQLIAYEWKQLYERLRKTYRTDAKRPDLPGGEQTRPNWVGILKELPEECRATFRFAFGKEFKYRDEEDAAREFIDVLTQFQPPAWGPRWLDQNGFCSLRLYWSNHFRTEDGKRPDWERLLRQLPGNLREGFTAV